MRSSPDQWAAVAARFVGHPDQAQSCPECGETSVQACFVGDPTTRTGFGAFWCSDCLVGIRISRMRIPEGADLLTFDDEETYRQRVPDFNEVEG